MNYSLYSDILEFEPNEILDFKKLENYEIFNYFHNFLINNKINNVLISLSGGVDSMVLAIIIKNLNLNINLYCCHINYNNRTESVDERNFLIDWCQLENIHLDVMNIEHFPGNTKPSTKLKILK